MLSIGYQVSSSRIKAVAQANISISCTNSSGIFSCITNAKRKIFPPLSLPWFHSLLYNVFDLVTRCVCSTQHVVVSLALAGQLLHFNHTGSVCTRRFTKCAVDTACRKHPQAQCTVSGRASGRKFRHEQLQDDFGTQTISGRPYNLTP